MPNVVIPLISLGSIPLVSHPRLLQRPFDMSTGGLSNTHPFAILISSPTSIDVQQAAGSLPISNFSGAFCWFVMFITLSQTPPQLFIRYFTLFFLYVISSFYYNYPFSCTFEFLLEYVYNGGQKTARETMSGKLWTALCVLSTAGLSLLPMPQGPKGQNIYRLHALKVSMVPDEYNGRGAH